MADPACRGLRPGASEGPSCWSAGRALSALRPGILLIAGLWCLSRTTMAIIARSQPYARGETRSGPRPFQQSARTGPGWPGPWPGPIGPRLACAGAASLAGRRCWPAGGWFRGWRAGPRPWSPRRAVAALARRRIGGFTGDVLGASGVLAETAGLLVAAARW